ncbi:MAG: DTW domain-containing protein [Oligoflexia bacterium]|nr:DTW domain-containing protein [Oligoflexia bacterium]
MNCPNCQKPAELCVCDAIRPQPTKTHVLILQHPQEPDKELGSALLANRMLPNSTLKIGLSWPNLAKALGREAQPSRWAVLHLGSGIKELTARPAPGLHFVTKNGTLLPEADRPSIDGLVVLDGTWSQAKTLWWRNAWLLKLKRAILVPSRPSLYRELRKEPRRECLSTIESIAESLTSLGEPPATGEELRKIFALLLDRKRAAGKR